MMSISHATRTEMKTWPAVRDPLCDRGAQPRRVAALLAGLGASVSEYVLFAGLVPLIDRIVRPPTSWQLDHTRHHDGRPPPRDAEST